jgi:D-glycero-alpha-D-manno-heptose 1-phosphate guanylyltransferase
MSKLPIVLILAGGLGTRLKSIVSDRPKALAEADGITFLDLQLKWLRQSGVKDIVLLLGYKAEQIIEYVGDENEWGLNINCLQERVPLGTGGSLLNAVNELKLEGELLLLNGDSLTEVALVDFCSQQRNLHSSGLVVVHQESASRFGIVQFNKDQELIDFMEKDATTTSGWINAGIYYFPAGWFKNLLKQNSLPCSLEKDLIPQWLNESCTINVFPVKGHFIDMGTPDSFAEFQQQVKLWSS